MNKITLFLAIAVAISPISSKAVDLLSLGSSGFTIEGGTITPTQTATTLSFASVGLGATVNGPVVGAPLDWSSAPAFGIRMTVSSGFDALPFRLTLYDSSYDGSIGFADFEGNTVVLTAGVEGTVNLSLKAGSVNQSSIIGLGVSWDGEGAANSSMAAVTAVPEPSTYAFLALGTAALGLHAYRRRRRA